MYMHMHMYCTVLYCTVLYANPLVDDARDIWILKAEFTHVPFSQATACKTERI